MAQTERLHKIESISGGHRVQLPISSIAPLAASIEIIVILLASIVASLVYHRMVYGNIASLNNLLSAGYLAAIFYAPIANSSELYRVTNLGMPAKIIGRLLFVWIISILLLTLTLFLLKIGSAMSRGAIIIFAGLGGASLLATRMLLANVLRRGLAAGVIAGRNAVIVGDRDELSEHKSIGLMHGLGAREIARILLPQQSSSGLALHRHEIAALDRALDIARSSGAEEMIVAVSWTNTRRVELIRSYLHACPLTVRLLPCRTVGGILRRSQIASSEAFTIELQRPPLSISEQAQKRALDLIVATGAILALSPLFLWTAVLIKLDSKGPVIFRQRRKGFNGRPFTIFKFRTMTALDDGPVVEQVRKGDPRVTAVGRLLRRTSIDELPQLFNVLKGHMSIVGPRPHAIAHDDQYSAVIGNYAFRHHVKPGITGWAQVNGYRGETAHLEQMADRVELDLWYINNWSLWLDCKVLLTTCFALARPHGAY